MSLRNYAINHFNISNGVYDFCNKTESMLTSEYNNADSIAEHNQYKVLAAMQKNKLSDTHFMATTGYGYNDFGRDTLESIYADIFNTESALVRPQIVSGTHALAITLAGNLRPQDEILSPAGKLYDTLEGVIGIREKKGSLKEYGISYKQVDLMPDGGFDYDNIKKSITSKTKLINIQRSKGYAWRRSFCIEEIAELIKIIKGVKPDVICMIDNCYGEFSEYLEPTDVGADMVVGSLIKNIGGGLAISGGYVAGHEEYVENAAIRLTAPGLGKEVGATLGLTRQMMQGLFLAPQVTSGCVKGAILTSKIFEQLGFEVCPGPLDKRTDIVQAIKLKKAENVIAFCEGIQKAAPVDSYVTPEPYGMPGYDHDVIMAAGTFIQGASIELSADAPMREPYIVYMQGGLNYHHIKIGIMITLQTMVDKGLIYL